MIELFPTVEWKQFLITSGLLFAIIVVRYFIIGSIFYYLLWKKPTRVEKLQDTTPRKEVIRAEIFWSTVTSVVFAIPGAYMIEAWKNGGTLIYTQVSEYGYFYLFLSVPLYMFIHDTYFYWTHRWLHRPKVFRVFHKVHHNSLNPTPWAAFSFHPYEGVIEAIIIPAMVFFIPIHIGALLFILTAMTFFSVVNHCGYEIYGRGLAHGAFGKWMITPTHHNLHHAQYDCNYGLYFRFWDWLMKTDRWVNSQASRALRRRNIQTTIAPDINV